jgi:hypothetical protein
MATDIQVTPPNQVADVEFAIVAPYHRKSIIICDTLDGVMGKRPARRGTTHPDFL